MIGVRVGDERTVDRPQRIDIKSAGATAKPYGRAHQQFFGTHVYQNRYESADANPAAPAAVMTSSALAISSGDLTADRRYAIARDFERRGDFAAAADVLTQALERAPGFSAAWFALGEMRERLGDRGGAGEAFRQALALDPQDAQGAGLRLARLEARNAPMPPAYVRTLFDQYAPRYEDALVRDLAYCAPRLLRDAVERVQRARGLPVEFRRMLDLGCGTGLSGEAFADCCKSMFGTDLSPAMIEQARRKNIYAGLCVGDLVEALEREEARADLIVAADAFVYFPDLGPLCRAAAGVLEPGGLFAFTAETHEGAGVVLGEKLRYAHSAAHVRTALGVAGLSVLSLVPGSPRKENALPVAGLVVIAGH
jgi:predicted TPR repeat methyltransferase